MTIQNFIILLLVCGSFCFDGKSNRYLPQLVIILLYLNRDKWFNYTGLWKYRCLFHKSSILWADKIFSLVFLASISISPLCTLTPQLWIGNVPSFHLIVFTNRIINGLLGVTANKECLFTVSRLFCGRNNDPFYMEHFARIICLTLFLFSGFIGTQWLHRIRPLESLLDPKINSLLVGLPLTRNETHYTMDFHLHSVC